MAVKMYKANRRGDGAAFKMEGDGAEAVVLTLAPQGDADGVPCFGWGIAIEVRLDLFEVAEVLRTIEGEQEGVLGGRGAFFHRTDGASVETRFFNEGGRFFLEMSRRGTDGGVPCDMDCRLGFTRNEIHVVYEALRGFLSMAIVDIERSVRERKKGE